ncbi:MAG: DUF502 domain-containing protein [Phycisphaerales bacterium]
MSKPSHRTFSGDFKRFFLRGLTILLPSVLTLWLLWAAFLFVQRNVAEPINSGIRQGLLLVVPRVLPQSDLPDWFVVPPDKLTAAREQRRAEGQLTVGDDALRRQIRAQNLKQYWNDRWYLRLIGLAVAIMLFYLTGLVLGGFFGRRIYTRVEAWFTRLPVFKQVYPSVKQLVDFVLGQKQLEFNRVVMVEYPRKGIYTVGLGTGPAIPAMERVVGRECMTVFIPSTPTPVTGFTITVPKDEVVELSMSIDEAFKFVVSGGVLIPPDRGDGAALVRGRSGGGLAAGAGSGKMVGGRVVGESDKKTRDSGDQERA